jgi:hypothetical protein
MPPLVEQAERHFCACHNPVSTPEGIKAKEANQDAGHTPAGLDMKEFEAFAVHTETGDI